MLTLVFGTDVFILVFIFLSLTKKKCRLLPKKLPMAARVNKNWRSSAEGLLRGFGADGGALRGGCGSGVYTMFEWYAPLCGSYPHVLWEKVHAGIVLQGGPRHIEGVCNHAPARLLPARALHAPGLVHHAGGVVKAKLLVRGDVANRPEKGIAAALPQPTAGVAAVVH